MSHASLGIGQVRKNGPLAEFEHLCFEPGPEALGVGVIVAVAATALRAHGLVVVEQGAIRVAALLPTAVGMHD